MDYVSGSQSSSSSQGLGIGGMNSGGIVPGTGNNDSVLTYLTPKEGVLPVSAMRKYGLSFFEAIRSGAFPSAIARTFGSGKSTVPSTSSSFSEGGVVGHGKTVNLNLNIGNQVYKLYGDEKQVDNLVRHIRREKRTIL
jgi:hypothetical protein